MYLILHSYELYAKSLLWSFTFWWESANQQKGNEVCSQKREAIMRWKLPLVLQSLILEGVSLTPDSQKAWQGALNQSDVAVEQYPMCKIYQFYTLRHGSAVSLLFCPLELWLGHDLACVPHYTTIGLTLSVWPWLPDKASLQMLYSWSRHIWTYLS